MEAGTRVRTQHSRFADVEELYRGCLPQVQGHLLVFALHRFLLLYHSGHVTGYKCTMGCVWSDIFLSFCFLSFLYYLFHFLLLFEVGFFSFYFLNYLFIYYSTGLLCFPVAMDTLTDSPFVFSRIGLTSGSRQDY